jgi:hypothetical protein
VDLAVLDHSGYEVPPHIQLLNEKLMAVDVAIIIMVVLGFISLLAGNSS